MNVKQFEEFLTQHPLAKVRFQLPSGQPIPPHFHVTEVGRLDKTFIDCGGTIRKSASCTIQTWTADDTDHQLLAGKLAGILKLAEPILGSEELPVEIEYGTEAAALYTISQAQSIFGDLTFVLLGKQTDCLAKEKCGVDTCNTATGCC